MKRVQHEVFFILLSALYGGPKLPSAIIIKGVNISKRAIDINIIR